MRGQNGTIGGELHVAGTQTLVNNGRISADVGGGTIEITQSAVTNNGTLEAINGGTLVLSSNVNGGVGSSVNIGAGSTVLQNGVTLSGAMTIGGAGTFRASNSGSNILDGATLNGTLDLATGTSQERVRNNLVLNGTINVNNNSILSSDGTNSFSGNGTIVFGATGPGNRFTLDGNGTTTLGSNITVRGQNGTIGNEVYVAGTQTLVNHGRISADVSGGTIEITQSAVTNSGTLEAINGGTLVLSSNVQGSSGGTIHVGAGSTVLQNGVALSGGLTITGPGNFRASNSGGNYLDGVSLNGTLDMATGTAQQRIRNDLVLNGAINVNNNSTLSSEGTNTLSGTGTIALGSTGSGNRFTLEGDGTTTLGSNITVRGQNGTIGGQAYIAGTQTLVNNGRIAADVSGGLIDIVDSSVVNNGVLQAINGGTLRLSSNVQGNSGSSLNIDAGSTMLQNGVTLSGLMSVTGGGALRASNSSANSLDGVTLNGTLDLASSLSSERIQNGLTLNGAININNNSILSSDGTNVIGGTGTIALGGTGSGNRFTLDGNGTTTLGAGITVRGENGTIGGQIYVAGTQVLVNQGKITADVAGGTLRITESAVTNQNLLEARNGGTLALNSAVTQTGSGAAHAASNGVVLLDSARLTGGRITTESGGVFRATNSSSNFLENVTVAGVVDMAASTAIARVNGGLTMEAGSRIDVNSNSVLSFDATAGAPNISVDGSGGEIVFGATGSGNRIILDGNGTTTFGSNLTVRGQNGTIGQQLFVAGTQTLINQGTIAADVSGGTITLAESNVQNTGTLRAANGGTLSIGSGVSVDNQGLVEARANSAVVFQPGSTTANNVGGTLTGGIWRADSVGGSSATITLRGPHITTNAADVYLVGANSTIQVTNPSNQTQSLDTTLATNDGSLRLQQGRSFNATANGGNFANNGLLEVTGSNFTSNTLVNNGTIVGFGTSSVTTAAGNRVTGNGVVDAVSGTLSISRGVDLSTSSNVISRSGATVDLSGATQASRTAALTNDGSLNLGAQNIVVTRDYTNASFGVGNAFDRRSNVTGAGQIIGQNASQTITGNVTSAGPNAFTLDLGNVRGGTSQTLNYQIANNGTGADIRGAVQTNTNGGSITDARLSGSGVTAQNFGPIAAGANGGNQSVSFTASSGGSLSGQSIAVTSNFDNVGTQLIHLQGNATALAQGSATPTSINLGNFHVGGSSATAGLNVANTTSGAGAERLGIGSVGTTGNFSATNQLGTGFVNGGANQANAISVGVSGGTAGVNTGSMAIQYTTNGTLIDPSFTTQNANAQNVALTATGYRLAEANAIGPINFGNVLVGSSQTRTVTVSNLAANDGFSEALNAAFGAIGGTDATRFSSAGAINGLLAGQTDNASMTITLNTSSSGAVTGNVQILLASNGDAIGNGLGITALPTQVINLDGIITGTVGNLATAGVSPTTVNFGKFREGMATSQTQQLTISNLTAGPGEGLNASFGPTTGLAAHNGGSVNGLETGASNGSAMSVTLNGLATAGAKSGTATLNFQSDGSFNNGTPTALPAQTVTMNAEVYRLAQAGLPTEVALAARRVGDAAATANLTLANTAAADGYSEGLRGSFGAAPTGFALAGPASTGLIAAGGSESRALSLSTGTAGSFSGAVNVALVTNGAGTSGFGDLSLGSGSVQVSGNVYAPAVAQLNTQTLNFGVVRVGDVVGGMNVSVTNAAAAAALNDTMRAEFGTVTGPFGGTGAAAGLGAGQSNGAGSLTVGLDTSAAGVFNGSALMLFTSQNPEMADLSLDSQLVTLIGQVNNLANADWDLLSGLGTLTQTGADYILDLGDVLLGATLSSLLQLDNEVAGPADWLRGSFDLGSDLDFSYGSAWGSLISGLGAGDAFGGLQIGFTANSLGLFEDLLTFNGFSYNSSDPDGIAMQRTLRIRANVIDQSGEVPAPGTLALLLAAGVAGWLTRRQHAARSAS
ncbi:MAG: beta strand repeat-containing protein [Burkholderiaceae bacterium]